VLPVLINPARSLVGSPDGERRDGKYSRYLTVAHRVSQGATWDAARATVNLTKLGAFSGI
jgi:hypothetical protein